MMMLLDLGSLAAIIVGYILSMRAMVYRTDKGLKFPSWSPKYWIPVWLMKPYFAPRGYHLYMWGTLLIILGVFVQIVQYWLT